MDITTKPLKTVLIENRDVGRRMLCHTSRANHVRQGRIEIIHDLVRRLARSGNLL